MNTTTTSEQMLLSIEAKLCTHREYQTRVLEYGVNLAIAPSWIPIKEIVLSTESLSRRLDRVTGTKLREEVKRCLDRAKPPKSNLSGWERDALRSLQRDDSIVVLPADKGNATVVVDRTSYNSKMMELLSDGSYKVLNRNPTTGIEKRVEDNRRSFVMVT